MRPPPSPPHRPRGAGPAATTGDSGATSAWLQCSGRPFRRTPNSGCPMRSLFSFLRALGPASLFAADAPNVLIVITDDQGFGDLGAHGNPVIHTPKLDAFTKESVRLKNFYVCPVCSPTRS